ncbi:MAG TPA: FHA domain-containing protein [Thermoanaerobaculia bacterium]|jgi:pSer/pThr/pTyr-binding forkhead associated (FHA) protein|nr:FHA domain-containing protein [Thermoanaerobaculia bacterium]
MPLIRCPRCGQAYDIPGVIAVRLPNSIATCHCGEWLAGSKAAVLARMLNPDQIKEVDLQPYRVDEPAPSDAASVKAAPAEAPAAPRSIRIVARGAHESVNKVFTIREHPLWIGRKGCHVDLPDSSLDLRHCSISVRGKELVVRDADSHMGTYLDGQKVKEAVIGEGVHLLRVGSALVSIEPTEETGVPVEPTELDTNEIVGDETAIEALRTRPVKTLSEPKRMMLVCIDGPLVGQEFEIPPTGLVVGREGHVRVPDEYLSRKHFEVFAEADGTIRVRDLGSRNGTFLNTLPAHNTKVQSGDEIRAGVHRFRVEQRA